MSQATYRWLFALYEAQKLPEDVPAAMLKPLARALTPYLRRYQAKVGAPPDEATLRAIVHNFIHDGPLVETLLNYHTPEAAALWRDLHGRLVGYTQRHWSGLDAIYQDKMVGATYLRIYRHLPNFLFKSRLDTWIFTILKNEYLRIKAQIELEQGQKVYLDDPIREGATLRDFLPMPQADLLAQVDWNQTLEDFWRRIEAVEKEPGPKMLRLHLAGYKLHEIQAELGENPPDVSTIQRRIRRMLRRLQGDPVINEIAWRLGLVTEPK